MPTKIGRVNTFWYIHKMKNNKKNEIKNCYNMMSVSKHPFKMTEIKEDTGMTYTKIENLQNSPLVLEIRIVDTFLERRKNEGMRDGL